MPQHPQLNINLCRDVVEKKISKKLSKEKIIKTCLWLTKEKITKASLGGRQQAFQQYFFNFIINKIVKEIAYEKIFRWRRRGKTTN
jgi:hypothetical protein